MINKKTAGFDLPHLHQDDKLRRVLDSALKNKLGNPSDVQMAPLSSYWNAAYFGLDKVKIFQEATVEEQTEILDCSACGLLEEAYFIEKAGVGYMAKMVSLAESSEERMLYALFSADEVTHLIQISRFLPNSEMRGTDNAFLRLLEDLAETQDKTVLLFVLQVVLEGWGLTHYRSLAKNCRNVDFSSVLQSFLQDESRHHGTGVTLLDRTNVTKSSQQTIIEVLALFLQMVQVGPQSVVAAIEKVKGDLSRQQKVQIFEQLNTENHSSSRLQLLRSLMRSPNMGTIVEELEVRGVFQPLPAEKCV
ncbi:MAG: ferritin-like domain-containing protein [Cyanomargarita calcarea GSE-NOS-MK-12-04C]|jgi:hypothetical protein|uniref:Ferritin-like domain-containing protein n=1 Tax=Cyanomargarita calcarea GSE-NOS-MK-12-04C TaxID=2839659 RepID=A0A951USG2_9CYAN|nr:ferritin-like domain-containing protein [Cyanomargarita calcarea GSE-NOS-MK-12-04C]